MKKYITVSETVKDYLKSTTLHGFKYLCSIHSADRISWLVCCCASACCAGVLCAVLWARFLEVPALLALSDDIRSESFRNERFPTVSVCLPPESVADMFLDKLSPNRSLTKRIPITLARLLTGKSTSKEQLLLLDELLAANNVTLHQAMMEYSPNCSEHTKKCRYQATMLPCEQLFKKELTYWGLCCVMRPNKLSNLSTRLIAHTQTTQKLELVLQCTHGSTVYGCQAGPPDGLTLYEGEDWEEPDTLTPGYYYMAQLRFTAVPENPSSLDLVKSTCEHDTKYSKNVCMQNCAEIACGCSDPFQMKHHRTKNYLPMCTLTRMGCLRSNEYKNNENISCHCLPPCKKITSLMYLEYSPITNVKHVIDPLYSGLNVTSSIVVSLRVNVAHSRVFLLNPTETWLTLLSSLGGVFNMFLGVGLFSGLEFIYLLIVKIPIALRKSSEIAHSASRCATPRPFR